MADEEIEREKEGEPSNHVEEAPAIEEAVEEIPPAITPVQGLNQIITETHDIVMRHQTYIIEQKKNLTTMMFMLCRISSNLVMYNKYNDQLFSFLYNNDVLQTEWYCRYCRDLPFYGDYGKVFPSAPEAMLLEGVSRPLAKVNVQELCQDVVENMFNGGSIVKVQRDLVKEIQKKMARKIKILNQNLCSVDPWMDHFATELKEEEQTNDKLFQIACLVHFLKADNSKQIEPLRLTLKKVQTDGW